tara:strand:- start:5487 stop:6761 length:1275 start_codon:yes stop_codon:yes gene_type:complete
MSFVKLKPKQLRRKLEQQQLTLGVKHKEILDSFEDSKSKIKEKEKRLDILKNELKNISISTNYKNACKMIQLEDNIEKLETEIKDAQSDSAKNKYFYNTSDILMEYYNSDEDTTYQPSSITPSITKNIDAGSGSNTQIRDFFTKPVIKQIDNNSSSEEDIEIDEYSGKKTNLFSYMSSKQTNNKGSLLDRYMSEIDKTYVTKVRHVPTINICATCNKEQITSHTDGLLLCETCGTATNIVIDSTKPCYKEPIPENSYFAYKRINHFKEWLSQFQAKESTNIPQDVYDAVLIEIKKAQIKNLATLKTETIRQFLKKLRLNKFYEHIPQIINKLNKLPPPVIDMEIEEKLCSMFNEIQEPFQECRPANRKNFLSYSYTLHKMTELLGLEQFRQCFNLLKSREKLKQQDRIWQCICKKLNWSFYPSI